jgi:c-di-AMP phosphodiesterase-like protein
MDFSNDIAKIKEQLDKAQDVLIVTHEHPTHDSMGSALALYLGLAGLGKKVTICCPDPMTVELSGFVGANKVIQSLGKKNFVISLDYVDGSIEKVSYNIEGDKFNLVIEPRAGFEAFSEDKVHYSYSGSAAHLIFTVDTIHLGGLKKLFDEDKDLYATKPIINVDRHPNNAHYGHTNMVDGEASSTAEVVAELLAGLGIAMTEDIATNLFNALVSATNNFQNPSVGAKAFELAASTTKAGAKRFAKQAVSEELPGGGETVKAEPVKKESTPAVQTPVAPVAPQEAKGHAAPAAKPSQAPPDWLKPKIFKSSNIS